MLSDTSLQAQDYVITVTSANTQYSLALPQNVKAVEFQARGAVAIIHSLVAGAVDTASTPGPYQTLKSGGVYKKEGILLHKATLYVACASATQVVEVRCWS
jgi:hypothetical protein